VAKEGRPLIIRDEIHGDMTLDPILKRVIDHEAFQRLRRIKQLGLADYVFPCATHTRFQHSLGASYLAGQYFDSMVKNWTHSPFRFDGRYQNTTFFSERTSAVVSEVAQDEVSLDYWRRVTCLSGLLHDVGHGPWSHTFEHLELDQNFTSVVNRLDGPIREFFDGLTAGKERLHHEELSVLYTFHILKSLGEDAGYFLPVATLLDKRLSNSPQREALQSHMAGYWKAQGIKGGLDFHRLLGPLISGPFDVDRIDYIQRDGRNCGVHIAGIEWRRIVSKLIPCLADHQSDSGEPRDVVLVSHIRNQHIIDDFIFTLFQMYAQVYMHPKIVGLEEAIRRILRRELPSRPEFEVTFDTHASLSDENFRELLENRLGIRQIRELLLRSPNAKFEVDRYPRGAEVETTLQQNGFELIEDLERRMMKDAVGVFLFSTIKEEDAEKTFVEAWASVSPIAEQLFSIHYIPNLWIHTKPGH
jgi:HD superfamily phosphohydrolase